MFATPFHKSFAMSTLRSRNQACGTAFRAFFLRRLGWTTSLRTPPDEASTPSRSWIGRSHSALPRERRTASRSVRVTQVLHSRSASQPTLLARVARNSVSRAHGTSSPASYHPCCKKPRPRPSSSAVIAEGGRPNHRCGTPARVGFLSGGRCSFAAGPRRSGNTSGLEAASHVGLDDMVGARGRAVSKKCGLLPPLSTSTIAA